MGSQHSWMYWKEETCFLNVVFAKRTMIKKQIGWRGGKSFETQLNCGEIWAKSCVNETGSSEFGGKVVGVKACCTFQMFSWFLQKHFAV